MAWPPERAFQTHRWQAEAINAWETADRRGVVEAVTGTGKTYAGLEAIDRLIRVERRLSTLIVVPTIVLLEQWRERLQGGWKPTQRVAQLGGGIKEDFSRTPIACVAVINSAITALAHDPDHAWEGQVAPARPHQRLPSARSDLRHRGRYLRRLLGASALGPHRDVVHQLCVPHLRFTAVSIARTGSCQSYLRHARPRRRAAQRELGLSELASTWAVESTLDFT
jgi:hypothetical protein